MLYFQSGCFLGAEQFDHIQVYKEKLVCAQYSAGALFCVSCIPATCHCSTATPSMPSVPAVLSAAAATVTGNSFTLVAQMLQLPT